MATTTIRMTPELRKKIARAAQEKNMTAHAYMLETLNERVEDAELYRQFHEEAAAAYAEYLRTDEAIEWPEMKRYMRALAAGKRPKPPVAKKVKR